MSHPEFDDQVRTAHMANFIEILDRLGSGHSFKRDGDCATCQDPWLGHDVFMVADSDPPAGYISCSVRVCACATTWGLEGAVPPQRCEYGATIRTDDDVVEQCALPAGGVLRVLQDDGSDALDVPMCTQHLVAMPASDPAQN